MLPNGQGPRIGFDPMGVTKESNNYSADPLGRQDVQEPGDPPPYQGTDGKDFQTPGSEGGNEEGGCTCGG